MADRCCGRDVTVFGHHWSCRTANSRAQLARPIATPLRAELDLHALKLGTLAGDIAQLRLAAIRYARDIPAEKGHEPCTSRYSSASNTTQPPRCAT